MAAGTIIFDFDGTIADSFTLMLEIAYRITGVAPLSDADVARMRRLSIRKIRKELGIPMRRIPTLIVKGRHEMQERIAEVQPFAGLPAVLRDLQAAGYELFIISSNSEHNVRAFLHERQLERYFAAVYGGVGLFDKASTLRKVLRRRRINKRMCWYVGDEVRDVIAAHKAGLQVAAAAWGYQAADALAAKKPEALLRAPKDLLALFTGQAV